MGNNCVVTYTHKNERDEKFSLRSWVQTTTHGFISGVMGWDHGPKIELGSNNQESWYELWN